MAVASDQVDKTIDTIAYAQQEQGRIGNGQVAVDLDRAVALRTGEADAAAAGVSRYAYR